MTNKRHGLWSNNRGERAYRSTFAVADQANVVDGDAPPAVGSTRPI